MVSIFVREGIGMNWTAMVILIQLFFGIVIGLYFLNLLINQRTQKVTIDKESRKEMEQLRKMREIRLTEPLAEGFVLLVLQI